MARGEIWTEGTSHGPRPRRTPLGLPIHNVKEWEADVVCVENMSRDYRNFKFPCNGQLIG